MAGPPSAPCHFYLPPPVWLAWGRRALHSTRKGNSVHCPPRPNLRARGRPLPSTSPGWGRGAVRWTHIYIHSPVAKLCLMIVSGCSWSFFHALANFEIGSNGFGYLMKSEPLKRHETSYRSMANCRNKAEKKMCGSKVC